MSPGPGPGPGAEAGAVAGCRSISSRSRGSATIDGPAAGRRASRCSWVTTKRQPLSASIQASRAGGAAGSSGTQAAPLLKMPRMAGTRSAERSTASATRTPGPAPRRRRWWARRLDHAASSA